MPIQLSCLPISFQRRNCQINDRLLCIGGCGANAPRGMAFSLVAGKGLPASHEETAQASRSSIGGADITRPKGHAPQLASQPSSDDRTLFNWTSFWWPVLPIESFDTRLPTHVDLLGKSLVVWVDSKGQWNCLEDRCAHKLGRLSEGRVEGDNIQCGYHGWTFEGSTGKCVRIPQLDTDPAAHTTACNSAKSCVASYPTRVSCGLLWIWPESGPQAAATAAATPNYEPPTEGRTTWFVRDNPIRFDTQVENLLDAAHVPFAHHSVQGNRNKVPNLNFVRTQYGKEGFLVTNKSGPFGADFRAPCWIRARPFLEMLIVPIKPGVARMITNSATSSDRLPWFINLVLKTRSSLPWLYHALLTNQLLDGDNFMLHMAEREVPLQKGVGLSWVKETYMPAPADAPVVAWRQWLQDFGGTVPTCSPGDEAHMGPPITKRQALDRYHQHTVNCKHCREALTTMDKLSVAAAAVGILAAITAVSQAIAAATLRNLLPSAALPAAGAALAPTLPSFLPAAAAAAVCLLLWVGLQSFRNKFIYEDWVLALK